MIRSFLLVLLPALFGAEDAWKKVAELKSGSELRILKTGAKQPIEATFDQLTEANLVVATKSEQVAIPKEEIDRVEFRPPRDGKLLKTDSRIKSETGRDGERAGPSARSGQGQSGPYTSTSTGMTINTRPGFQTIYKRTH